MANSTQSAPSLINLSPRAKVMVIAGTMLGMFTSAMDQSVVGTSMPRIVADLGGFGLFSWVGTSFMLASTASIPIVGKLTDVYGRKPFFMGGILVLLLGSALAGSSTSMGQLIAFRAVQGLGAGSLFGIAYAIIGDIFPPAQRGKWSGLMSAVFAAASVAGPLIGGFLTDHVHWRWVFYVNLPLGAVALAVLFFGMPYVRPAGKARLDYRGITLMLLTIVPMLLAFSWAGSRYDWGSPQILGMLAWAAAMLMVFLYAERRTEEPLLPLPLFGDRVFGTSAAIAFITAISFTGSIFYVPLFIQGVIGSSATNSGMVTMPMMISMTIASTLGGQIVSRLGRYKMVEVIGLLIMVAGLFMLSQLSVTSRNFDATLAMIVVGAGVGVAFPTIMLAVQNAVAHKFMGIATSSIQFVRSIGAAIGVALVFSLVQRDYTSSLQGRLPETVRNSSELSSSFKDPQFLMNDGQFNQVRDAFDTFGAQSATLFEQSVHAVRTSLASAMGDAFFVTVLVTATAVLVSLLMRDMPLKKQYAQVPEPSQEKAPAPIAGGSGLEPKVASPLTRSVPSSDGSKAPENERLESHAGEGRHLRGFIPLAALIALASAVLVLFVARKSGR